MNANYIYDIFAATEKNQAPDLNIGLAMLRETKPIPEGMEDQGIREFIGRHYKKLTAAYRAKDRYVFRAVVSACEAEDKAREEE